MINANMRLYDYYTIGAADEYGQQKMSDDVKGKIKMAISVSSQTVQDNILYQGCQYVGLTHDAEVNDAYIIRFGEERLKVLYVSPQGRLRLVFMVRMG